MSDAADSHTMPNHRWLWMEFAFLYLFAPLSMAWAVATGLVPTRYMPAAFFVLFVLAIKLLKKTPSFEWRSLPAGALIPHWPLALGFLVVTTMVTLALTYIEAPQTLFFLPTQVPTGWLMMTLIYPIFSVLPQGLIYRALFFNRYEVLFKGRAQAIAVSAVIFGLAHLFYLNWVAVVLTIFGGAVFSWAYVEKRSFPFSVLLHALAGWLLFTIGLGVAYFFHGSIDVFQSTFGSTLPIR